MPARGLLSRGPLSSRSRRPQAERAIGVKLWRHRWAGAGGGAGYYLGGYYLGGYYLGGYFLLGGTPLGRGQSV
eukprot:1192681-Prorocentrum_minimum.AAC.2